MSSERWQPRCSTPLMTSQVMREVPAETWTNFVIQDDGGCKTDVKHLKLCKD